MVGERSLEKVTLQAIIKDRLTAIFVAYQQGKDVTPAQRYKWEGVVELAIEQGLMAEQEVLALQQAVYSSVFGGEADIPFQAGKVPALMVKAPVKPTTKD